ncbi:hypothetical protein Chor_005078 [Crotalus horridus]
MGEEVDLQLVPTPHSFLLATWKLEFSSILKVTICAWAAASDRSVQPAGGQIMGGKYQKLKGQKGKHFKSPNTSLAKILIFPMTIREHTKVKLLGCMTGPVANIRHNLGEVVRSISCTVELQIENAKKAWKISLAPMRKILKDMVHRFLVLMKSRIIQQAVRRCRAWFQTKHRSCMQTIAVPLVNHLLCLPMKFSFLCYLAKVMNTWCRDKIPVEGNFGQTYDRVNDSVENLNQDFTASVVIQVYQSSKQLGTAVTMLRVLLSCMFILVFASAYSYTNKYNEDIRFDNLYISRYFRQIDARRRKQKKRTLLPLRRAEESQVIEPLRLAFQPAETKSVMLELLGCLPPLVFLLMACALDSLLYTIFSTIRNHSFIQYSFRSSHHLEVKVGGETLMARLLRSTIGALNTSSEMVMETNNLQCLPEPRGMSRDEYVKCTAPLGALVVLCFLQVYVFRLRRVIAAFYFPKREKKRIIYLYNEMLRRRVAFVLVQRKRIILQARRRKRVRKPLLNRIGRCCPFLKRILLRRCILCNRPESRHSLTCSNPECETVYCQICWKDMGKICFACHPEHLVSEDESSEGETGYAD